MKTVVTASIILAVLGLVGSNDAQMSVGTLANDTVNICQRAEDSFYDGQLHDRDAEHKCSEMIDRISKNNQYEILYKDGTYWAEKK